MKSSVLRVALATVAAFCTSGIASAAWEPVRPVEFIIPAGTGGGADQMARTIQGIVTKHNLMKQPMVVINKSGGAGGEGFLDVKSSAGNPHKIIITLSNLFTTPLATGIPFNWKDLTPVAMLALDEFVLWVNTDKPYKNVKDYIDAVKKAPPGTIKMGGTGSKQEDQIITVAIEGATEADFTYVPFDGGGDVAAAVVGGHIDSSVNNPIEQVSHWQGEKTRPLCVFAANRLEVEGDIPWGDIPTCEEAGVPMQYQMLRGIFMPAGVDQEAVDYYVELFKKVREQPEWKEFMKSGAFTQTFMSGDEYKTWVANAADLHKKLMTEAGFIAK
jgi:putative tricarboxylic transport membrane protein